MEVAAGAAELAGMSQRYRPYWPRVTAPVATNVPSVPDFMRTVGIEAASTAIALVSPVSPA